MTVQELIDQLRRLDPSTEVVVDDVTGSGFLHEPDLHFLDGPPRTLIIRTPSEVQASAEVLRDQFRALD